MKTEQPKSNLETKLADDSKSAFNHYVQAVALSAACFSPFILSGCDSSPRMSTPEAASPNSIEKTELEQSYFKIASNPSQYLGNRIDLSYMDPSRAEFGGFHLAEKIGTRFNNTTKLLEEFQIWQGNIELSIYKVLVVGDEGLGTSTSVPTGIWSQDSKGGYFLDARKGLGKPDLNSPTGEATKFSDVAF